MAAVKSSNSKKSQQSLNAGAKEESAKDLMIVFKSKAPKMSPKSKGFIQYQLVKDKKDRLFIQLLSNTSGGIFSKELINLTLITTALKKLPANRPFKSSSLKEVFTGKGAKSANNPSFLAAVLRSKNLGLIVPDAKSQFLSQLSPDFDDKLKQLMKN
ncbi:MAG: hypothetical protein HWE16_06925 [Gammaproteobacteria bacterium]|nr:hypothetical protein [Gammaproteobacteria bacterium]